MEIITTETTETMDDGSTCTTVKTVKKGAGLDTFHKETRKALDDSKREFRGRRWEVKPQSFAHGSPGYRIAILPIVSFVWRLKYADRRLLCHWGWHDRMVYNYIASFSLEAEKSWTEWLV